jgi:hypothetical protein
VFSYKPWEFALLCLESLIWGMDDAASHGYIIGKNPNKFNKKQAALWGLKSRKYSWKLQKVVFGILKVTNSRRIKIKIVSHRQ